MPKIVDHDERRQAIVDAMWRIVARDGFDAVSVRSVAAAAGLSKSTIAHYFTTRDEVLAYAVTGQIESNLAQLAALDVANCSPEVAANAIMIAIPTTPAQRRNSQAWLALLEAGRSNSATSATLTQLNSAVRDGVSLVLRALAANGLMGAGRDVYAEAVKIHAVIDGLSLQSMTDPSGTPPTLVLSTVELLIHDLRLPLK